MAVITPSAKTQFIGANGEPLVGGKLYTYAAGTTTPLPTYTDNTGATPNTNPIILDSRGEANVWLGEATYKFKLTDANDVEIWTVDYIAAPTTALSPVLTGNVTISSDSSGPALKITQTGTGYVMRVQDSADPDLTPFVINASGYVGLGTTAPAEALDIDNNGKLQFSSNGTALTVISADATNSTIDVKNARNFVVKTNGSTNLTVSSAGALTAAGGLTVSAGGASITGNSSITGTLSATSNITTSAGNIAATTGSITAGTSVTATTSVITDTVSERTGGAGVTVAGVPIISSAIAGDYIRIASKTVQATTSGTSVPFTSIPTWARRITIMFFNVTLSGADKILVQIGPSGGIVTSGYSSTAAIVSSASATTASSTSGFLWYSASSGYTSSGQMTICLVNPAAYTYCAAHSGQIAAGAIGTGGGYVTLSGLMTQLTIKPDGANTFTAGSINVLYE